MANNVTYVMMHLGDDDGREQSHLLGTLHEVYATNGRIVVGPPSEDADAIFTQAGGALWLTLGRGHAVVDVNHHTPYDRHQPLFDGDLITLRQRSAIVRL